MPTAAPVGSQLQAGLRLPFPSALLSSMVARPQQTFRGIASGDSARGARVGNGRAPHASWLTPACHPFPPSEASRSFPSPSE